jgi:enamine deaminase RidA (YjgF/YER057c/UK114 family)
MYKMVFPNITVGPAFFDATGVILSKPLTLSGDATAATHAVTKSQLDVVNARVSEIVAAAGTDFDTFVEIKSFMETADASGITHVMNAVTAEESARVAAVSAEEAARVAAVSAEVATRVAVVEELSDRINDEAATRYASDTALSNKLFSKIDVPLGTAILGGSAAPKPIPSSYLNAGLSRSGWYFKNPGTTASNPEKKINWYLPAPANAAGVATVDSLSEIAVPVRLISAVSRPFVTVYTARKGDGTDGASWYNARYSYVVNMDLSANTDYLLRAKFFTAGTCVINEVGCKNVELVPATAAISGAGGANVGTMALGDSILFMSIGTDSGSAAGNVECIIYGCKMLSTNGNAYHTFSNADVMNKYLMAKVADMYATFGQSDPSV